MDTTCTINTVEWFFGYGGNHLGLKRAIPNLRLVAACEIEAFAISNMVAKMEAGLLDAAPIWSDCKTFPTEPFAGRVDLFIASYPCQPFSSAGKRQGAHDERHLWPYVIRWIRSARPVFVFLENVEGHVSLGLSTVISDLEEAGYRTSWGLFDAASEGAPHKRTRIFIMAYRKGAGLERYDGLFAGCDKPGREPSQPQGPANGGDCGGTAWPARPGELVNAGIPPEDSLPAQCGGRDISREGTISQPSHPWPSRPGEPQHAWEPPRVVAASPCIGLEGRQARERSETRQDAAGRGEAMVNSDSNRRLGDVAGTETEPHRDGPDNGLPGATGAMGDTQSQRPAAFGAEHAGLGGELCVASAGSEGELGDPAVPRCSRSEDAGADCCHESQGVWREESERASELGNPNSTRPQEWQRQQRTGVQGTDPDGREDADGEVKSPLGRDAHGPAGGLGYAELCVSCDNRTDELRLLGNGVVPACAETAFRTLFAELITR